MKRIATALIILISILPAVAVAPVGDAIGTIGIRIEKGGISEKALEAVGDEVSVVWFEKYTTNEKLLVDTFYIPLSEILPFGNPVCSLEKNGAVSLLDLDSGAVVSFTFSSSKLINSVSFSR